MEVEEEVRITNTTQNKTFEIINDICLSNERSKEVTVSKFSYYIKEANLSGEILVMMLLLTLTMTIGHILRKNKFTFLDESMTASILGLIAGFILKVFGQESILKNITDGYVKFFLIILLPPIIFEA